jgi:hypothetical protein
MHVEYEHNLMQVLQEVSPWHLHSHSSLQYKTCFSTFFAHHTTLSHYDLNMFVIFFNLVYI